MNNLFSSEGLRLLGLNVSQTAALCRFKLHDLDHQLVDVASELNLGKLPCCKEFASKPKAIESSD